MRYRKLRPFRLPRAILHGVLCIECTLIFVFTLVIAVLCQLNLFWYPQQLWLWIGLGGAGICAVVVSTVLDDYQLASLVIRTHALARRGLLVMHSRSLLATLLSAAAWRQRMSLQPMFNGPLAQLRSRELNEWFVEAAALAHSLDTVVGDTTLVDLIRSKSHAQTLRRHEDRAADLIIDVPDMLQSALTSTQLSWFQRRRLNRIAADLRAAHQLLSESQNKLEQLRTTHSRMPQEGLYAALLLTEIAQQRRKFSQSNRSLRASATRCGVSVDTAWRRIPGKRALPAQLRLPSA